MEWLRVWPADYLGRSCSTDRPCVRTTDKTLAGHITALAGLAERHFGLDTGTYNMAGMHYSSVISRKTLLKMN